MADGTSDPPLLGWLEQFVTKHNIDASAQTDGPDVSADVSAGDAGGSDDADGPTRITFEPKEIHAYQGNPGRDLDDLLTDLFTKWRFAIEAYWDNYRDGLKSFTDAMKFSSEQAAEPKYLETALTTVAKEAFGVAFDKAVDGLKEGGSKVAGPAGILAKAVLGVSDALIKEKERAAKAAGEVKILEYVTTITHGIDGAKKKIVAAFESNQRPLFKALQEAAGGEGLRGGKPNADGLVVGDTAKVLSSVKAALKAFQKATPSAAKFQGIFTTRIANTPGWSEKSANLGGRPTGVLHFWISLYLEPKDPNDPSSSDKWTSKEKAKAWTLVTKAPKPEQMATSLNLSLKSEGIKPYQVKLPKMVKLRIEIEEPGLNAYREGYIYFEGSNPDSYEIRSNYGKQPYFHDAWKYYKKLATGTTKIEGSKK